MTPPESAVFMPIPLVVMIGIATWRDMRSHRIDNWITFPGALFAIGLHLWLAGFAGLAFALGGLIVGLVALLPFHVTGGMAAGDVKLMAAAGAFLGPIDVLLAAAVTLVAGSVLALVVLFTKGGLREGLGHIGRQFVACGMTRVWITAAANTAAAQRFPYAAAIGCGCLAIVLWRWFGTMPVLMI